MKRISKRAPSRRVKRQAADDNEFRIRLTHPDRVVYPEQGLTKADLVRYYIAVAERMLPHVIGRPLSLVRCPEGTSGACFFQKHPAIGMSEALGRVKIREKDEVGTYLFVRDLEGLLSLVQFGALEIHVWGSLADDVERPDRIIFDLDPDPAVNWSEVVAAAHLLREVLDEFRLKSFVKTTGGKGLHVVVPIVRKHPWPKIKSFCRALAETIAAAQPERFVANMSKAKRRGRIFIDYLRNDRGATSVAAYSTRARNGAPVSLPVSWNELTALRSAADFTVGLVPKKIKRQADPWRGIHDVRQNVDRAMKVVLGNLRS